MKMKNINVGVIVVIGMLLVAALCIGFVVLLITGQLG